MIVPILLLFLILAAMILLVAVFISAVAANRSASPFWPTPEAVVRIALREAGVKKDDTVYDLGAGAGSVVLVADRDFEADAHGFEISLLFYLIAIVRIRLAGLKARMHFKSFFDADLAQADIIFCFLLGTAIKKLWPVIKQRARPGTKIISYRFRFHDLEPIKIIPIDHQRNVYIYEMPGK